MKQVEEAEYIKAIRIFSLEKSKENWLLKRVLKANQRKSAEKRDLQPAKANPFQSVSLANMPVRLQRTGTKSMHSTLFTFVICFPDRNFYSQAKKSPVNI
jgi:hypothetical protein